MTLDISHAQLYCAWADESLEDYIARCLPYTRHVHIADASGIDGEGVQIEEGVIDWEAVLRVLAPGDFTWVPEIWSGHLHQNAGFVKALNLLGKYGVL